ncbi:hypothetical protein L3X39_02130 [Sabulilitoribacter multivorans]|uniref:PD-(D/E)XK nuclease superfamily protein n=1 Tax=Flaviramulus multivorans TaxID=1304750 RepID=A0ABS9IF63_9FLAO|nr:hypothetical protein [Flaviramulus multivorans]MCF7559419.1 hypothetical protein [Flaviramulus multivorans]
MNELLNRFIEKIKKSEIDLYNEFGLQFELALFLRNSIELEDYKIELERPINHFGIKKNICIPKKEIDICVYRENTLKTAIEIKVSTNGQVPLQLFEFCKDICFLEKLLDGKFESAYSLVVVNSDDFYKSKTKKEGIYAFFRGENKKQINGIIECPTGKDKGKLISISNSYKIVWADLIKDFKFYLIEIKKPVYNIV